MARKASDAFCKAHERWTPSEKKLGEELCKDLLNIHVFFETEKKFQEGLASCRMAVGCDENSAYAWHKFGTHYSHLNKSEEALAAFDKAISLESKYASPWDGKGNVLYNLNKPDEALVAYDKAIELNPKYASPWNGKAWLFPV